MAYGTTLVEHYKLDADTYHDYTIHTRKVRRVEERERWDHVEKIGWGSSGFVWLQEKTSMVEGHKEQRAVKVLEKGMMRQMGIDYMKELEALTEFRKPKILQEEVLINFYGWFEDKDKVFLAMEYFALGDLERYITSDSITEQDAKYITVDLLKAVELMHAEDFTHRDIKPKNILVLQNSPKWFVKLGDFGITKRTNNTATALRTNTGTPLYSAPEIGCYDENEDDVYTKAVDIWSVGCVVYHILAQRAPFKTAQAKKKPFPTDRLVGRASGDAIKFLSSLLVLDPAGRPAAAEALKHTWLVNVHPAESAAGRIHESKLSTQFSLQSLEEQDSEGMLTRLSTDIRARSNTEKWRGMPSLQSSLRSRGEDGPLVETQERPPPSVMQPESKNRRTQHTMNQSNAGSDAATEKQPPSSQINRPRHTSNSQLRAASSALPPPETFGIQTEPSAVVNTTASVFTHRAPTAPALFAERGILTPKSSSGSAASSFSRIALSEKLRNASENGRLDGVQGSVRYGVDEFLLYRGANFRAHNANNSNPLDSTTRESYNDVTRLFSNKGAVVDGEGKNGHTSLYEAAATGDVSVARDLLEHGANINVQNKRGWTALHVAARHNYKEIVGMLLAANAHVNMQNNKACTALYLAARYNCKDIVDLLLAADADINMQNNEGWTALHIAARNNCKDIVGMLLAADADINMQNNGGCTALHFVAVNNYKEIVGMLLAANAHVNMQNNKACTALYLAARYNCKDIVIILIAAGATVNLATESGMTALHIATHIGHVEVVETLLQTYVNVRARDSSGKTALDVAKEKGQKEVIAVFARKMAEITAQELSRHRGGLSRQSMYSGGLSRQTMFRGGLGRQTSIRDSSSG